MRGSDGLSLETTTTSFTKERPLFVNFEVAGEIALLGERVLANGASEGFLVRVCAKVIGEMRIVSETTIAMGTREGLLSRMNTLLVRTREEVEEQNET